jgi:signal transduction histidine kinase
LWGREPARNDPNEKYCGSFNIYYLDGRLMPHDNCPMARMLKGEILDPQDLEMVVEQPDGTRRSVIAHPLPIRNARGEIIEAINCLYDITERKQAEDALQLLNLQLESRVVVRTAELQDANIALHENRKRLQILSQRLVEVQEEERRAIARELHDRVGQSLSALNINMIIMRDQLYPDSLERVGARLADSMHLVGETITLVRDVMSNLRPAVLDDYGLEAALQSHIDEDMLRYEIKVVLERPARPLPRLGPSIEMTFLRIAQEALMNIARHANASQVTLSLWQEGDSVCMTIQDNGSGIVSWQQANRPGSHGLTIMRERAEAFGGNLKVGSVPGQGTRIEMSIPLGKGSQNDVPKEMFE